MVIRNITLLILLSLSYRSYPLEGSAKEDNENNADFKLSNIM